MSIRQGILALLADEPMYGYQLRAEFEARTGATWPLNVGQVYTTLQRLERDGLVLAADQDEEGRHRYSITAEGSAELSQWFASPVDRTSPPRDELAIKLAMAVTVPGVDVRSVVARQRVATVRALQEYTRLKARLEQPSTAADLSWQLVLESLIFDADAEIRWLDHCESRLLRVAGSLVPATDRTRASGPGALAGSKPALGATASAGPPSPTPSRQPRPAPGGDSVEAGASPGATIRATPGSDAATEVSR